MCRDLSWIFCRVLCHCLSGALKLPVAPTGLSSCSNGSNQAKAWAMFPRPFGPTNCQPGSHGFRNASRVNVFKTFGPTNRRGIHSSSLWAQTVGMKPHVSEPKISLNSAEK